MDERRIAAYHEAGHALVALYCGVGVKRVEIDPDGSGRTMLSTPLRRLPAWIRGAIAMAGPLAAARISGVEEYGPGDQTMLDQAVAELRAACGGAGDGSHEVEVYKAILDPLGDVPDVAERLLAAGSLSWRQLPRRRKPDEPLSWYF
jgi:hypothetical protein